MLKNKWFKLIKVLISFLLIFWLLRKVDFRDLIVTINSSNKMLLLFALILSAFGNLFLSCYKWKKILQIYKIEIPLLKLSKSYLVGMFFNMFLPGITGGDLVKAHDISKITKQNVKSYVSVFIERATGIIGLFVNVFIALIFAYRFIDIRVIYFVLMMFLALLFLIWFVYNRELLKKMILFHWLSNKFNLDKLLMESYEAIYLFKNKKKQITYVILLSFLFQFVVVIINYIIALALGIKVSFAFFWLFIPIISLITMVPVSINGIGVRDISYVTCFKQVGIPTSFAFSISLLVFGMGILLSSIGGIVYAFRKD